MKFGSYIHLNYKLVWCGLQEFSVICTFAGLLMLLLAERTCLCVPGVANWTNFGSRIIGGNLRKNHALIK